MRVCYMTCFPRWLRANGQFNYNLPRDTIPYVDINEEGPAHNAERIIFDNVGRGDGILIVQDDVIIEPWFMDQVYASLIPDEPMTFHSRNPKALDWYNQGYSYAKVWQITGQANYYPQWLLRAYTQWVTEVPPLPQRGRKTCVKSSNVPEDFAYRKWCGDDSSMTACLMWLGRRAYLTLPNLCQHNVAMKSTIRPKINSVWQSKVFGKDLLREWDYERVFDEEYYEGLAPYVHPTQKDKYLKT